MKPTTIDRSAPFCVEKSPGLAAALVGAMVLIGSSNARAQAIDYGSLEALFGEPVTTSVTGSPQRASEAPASMIIVTQDEIRRSGAHDIPGILNHVPGLNILQWTNDQADVAVRGYNQAFSSRTLVLVDGRQVYADEYGYTPWSTLPVELSAIRQIEIVLGPNSALFGFNAVGGVINIITYDPLYDDVNAGSVSGGTQGFVEGSGIATFKFGDSAGLRISLGGRRNNDFGTPQQAIDVGSRRGDDRKAIDVLGHATYDGFDATIDLSHSEAGQVEVVPLYTESFTNYRLNSLKGTLSTETGIGSVQATAYGNWFHALSTAPNPFAPIYSVNNTVYVAQLRDIFKVGNNNTFRLTAEYRHNEMATIPVGGAHVFYGVFSAAAMWNWSSNSGWSLTNALRFDHLSLGRSGLIPPGFGLSNADWNNRSLAEVSFNSGLVWKYDESNTFRATAARGVQLPNLIDLGGLLLAIPHVGYAGGIPTVKPTILMNYELSWDRALPQWNAQFHLRAFYQTSRDIAANGGGSLFPLGLVATPANIGSSRAIGAELSLDGTFAEDWRWVLSYSPEVVSDNFSPGFNATTVLVDYEHTNPVHIVRANLGWAHARWEIDGYLRYQSRFDSIRGLSSLLPTGTLVRIPDYASADARLAYRLTDNLTLALSGQNLFQSPQTQTSGPAVERRVEGTVAVAF